MDDELREIENASKQVVDLYKKTFSTTAKVGGEAVSVAGKVVSAVASKVADDVETYKDRAEARKEKKKAQKPTLKESIGENITGFNFTGQFTDLCYFQQAEKMPMTAIANIQDPKLKEAVIDNFQKAANEGLLEIKDGYVAITNKGKKEIKKPSFQKAAQEHQMQAYQSIMEKVWSAGLKEGEVQMGAVLTGHYINDFTFFNHSQTLDLNDISKFPNKELSSKILSNINDWEKQGFVSINRQTGIANITAKGQKLLKSEKFLSMSKAVEHKPVSALRTNGGGIFIPTIRKLFNPVAQVKKVAGRT